MCYFSLFGLIFLQGCLTRYLETHLQTRRINDKDLFKCYRVLNAFLWGLLQSDSMAVLCYTIKLSLLFRPCSFICFCMSITHTLHTLATFEYKDYV